MTTISLTRTLTASAILISAALLPVHATAGDALNADLGKYPGSTLAAPTGHVSVKFHQNKLSVAYDLEKQRLQVQAVFIYIRAAHAVMLKKLGATIGPPT